jgi:hypothetical protein
MELAIGSSLDSFISDPGIGDPGWLVSKAEIRIRGPGRARAGSIWF